MFGCTRNPLLLAFVDCVGRCLEVAARLDLDRDQQPGPACDDVDLPDRTAIAACRKPKTLQAQLKCCMPFGAMAAPLGGLAAD